MEEVLGRQWDGELFVVHEPRKDAAILDSKNISLTNINNQLVKPNEPQTKNSYFPCNPVCFIWILNQMVYERITT